MGSARVAQAGAASVSSSCAGYKDTHRSMLKAPSKPNKAAGNTRDAQRVGGTCVAISTTRFSTPASVASAASHPRCICRKCSASSICAGRSSADALPTANVAPDAGCRPSAPERPRGSPRTHVRSGGMGAVLRSVSRSRSAPWTRNTHPLIARRPRSWRHRWVAPPPRRRPLAASADLHLCRLQGEGV